MLFSHSKCKNLNILILSNDFFNNKTIGSLYKLMIISFDDLLDAWILNLGQQFSHLLFRDKAYEVKRRRTLA